MLYSVSELCFLTRFGGNLYSGRHEHLAVRRGAQQHADRPQAQNAESVRIIEKWISNCVESPADVFRTSYEGKRTFLDTGTTEKVLISHLLQNACLPLGHKSAMTNIEFVRKLFATSIYAGVSVGDSWTRPWKIWHTSTHTARRWPGPSTMICRTALMAE